MSKKKTGLPSLARHYQHAMVFIYPSLYEGFGIPPLDAMNFDCPVACSALSLIPEVVGNAGAYFDPGDIGQMSLVIEQLVTNESNRSQLVHVGRKRVKLISWARCAKETLTGC